MKKTHFAFLVVILQMSADHNVTHHYYDECARPSDHQRDKKEYAVVNSMAKIGLLTFGEPCVQGRNAPPLPRTHIFHFIFWKKNQYFFIFFWNRCSVYLSKDVTMLMLHELNRIEYHWKKYSRGYNYEIGQVWWGGNKFTSIHTYENHPYLYNPHIYSPKQTVTSRIAYIQTYTCTPVHS